MQEHTNYNEQAGRSPASSLPEFRPDERSLREFRSIGRIGIVVSLIACAVLVYYIYRTVQMDRLYRKGSSALDIHFYYMSFVCVIYATSTILLLRSSVSLLKYGMEPDNLNLHSPLRRLRTWFICGLVNIIIDVAYFAYLFLNERTLR